jgi:hypothetical protein
MAARRARAAERAHAAHRRAHEPRSRRSGITGAYRSVRTRTGGSRSWSIGRNLQVDYRWGGGDAERIRKDAAELLTSAPDVILASGNPSVAALQQATRSVPIVFSPFRFRCSAAPMR